VLVTVVLGTLADGCGKKKQVHDFDLIAARQVPNFEKTLTCIILI
jgi:hypothetical protein